MRKTVTVLAALSVSACSTGISKLPGVNAPSSTVRAPGPRPATPTVGAFKPAQVQNAAGLESVLGQRASSLTQRFGKARIDLTEGDARKLQFLGTGCVLDIYLYPREERGEPVATHVEARSLSDGEDTDRARCIREVERGE